MSSSSGRWLLVAALLTAAAALPAGAQQPGEPDFARHLFPPELVMRHQEAIGVSPAQRRAITEAVAAFQARVTPLQWDLAGEAQALTEALAAPRVDSAAVLERVNRVLGAESQVKRAHLALLVSIKNALTPEQQAMLRRLRDPSTGAGGPVPPGKGGQP